MSQASSNCHLCAVVTIKNQTNDNSPARVHDLLLRAFLGILLPQGKHHAAAVLLGHPVPGCALAPSRQQ